LPEARVDALRIEYGDSGAAPGLPIVCLTGWCSSRSRYDNLVPLAARSRRVVTIDWRGHGGSESPAGDFGTREMADDVVGVVDALALDEFALVSASHSGWVALEVRRRLGTRVSRVVHFDWLVFEPSDPYMAVIRALQGESTWEDARDTLFQIWRGGVDHADVERAIEVMGAQGKEMWMRSGREIEAAFLQYGSPTAGWGRLDPRPQILHVYGQPHDTAYLERQQAFARDHDWFDVHHVPTRSHFTMIEAPQEANELIDSFLG
jgi:pimeloyl-ACP methyl ester carboxylesterase